MVKIKKLKSGRWHAHPYLYTDENGKRVYASITADTKADVEYQLVCLKRNKQIKTKAPEILTVREAIDKYIALSEVLSPTTLHSYETIKKNAFKSIMDKQVSMLTDTDMQIAINEEAKRKRSPRKSLTDKQAECTDKQITEKTKSVKPLSAKTIKNEWGLVSAALYATCKVRFNVKLPKNQKHIKEYPEPKKVLDAIVGSSIELPCLLAMWLSFSMSEIRGLKCSDISGDYITVNRVLVDVGTVPTVKDNAKVETRLRRHKIPPYIKELIVNGEIYQNYQKTKTDAFLVPLTRNIIYGRWQTICKEHDLELSFHDLRHMNASIMLMLNVPEKYAMERGGWKTPVVLKTVYQHTFDEERVQVDKQIDSFFEEMLQK